MSNGLSKLRDRLHQRGKARAAAAPQMQQTQIMTRYAVSDERPDLLFIGWEQPVTNLTLTLLQVEKMITQLQQGADYMRKAAKR